MARLRLPETVPEFGDRLYKVYRVFWFTLLALAIIGPVAAIYVRSAEPSDNSALMLGSRAGFVVSQKDATQILFTVGPETRQLGIKAGDKIVAMEGLPLPKTVPFSQADIIKHEGTDELAYVLLPNLFFSSEPADVQLRIRSPDRKERDVLIHAGDQHIAAATSAMHITPSLLRYVDLLHVITYPFLLMAAWLLHKRQARDPVSCILSLAILLAIVTERPAADFFERTIGVPPEVQFAFFDLGRIFLLAGILLFPHGKLSFRLVALIACLPVLLLLEGNVYRGVFILFVLCAVAMMINCLRRMEEGETRQQIKWALFGFSGYAVFFIAQLICEMVKPQAGSFAARLILEMSAGLSLGLAFLTLQMGLLVALLRFRLYDAEFVISRSATFAGVTLVLGAVVAGVIQGLGTVIQSTFGANAGAGAAGVGAAMATALISPAYERINAWMEKRFHKNLLDMRNGLPETVRDLRETASLSELLEEVLRRVRAGIQTERVAVIVDGKVEATSNVTREETLLWLNGFAADEEKKLCDGKDMMFRVRAPLRAHGQRDMGWLLVGPRPDGTSPRDDEEDALVAIADPIARAIGIVVKRDGEEKQIASILDELRQRIDEIETGLSAGQRKAQA